MTIPTFVSRGGFRKPIQLSLFIRDYLLTQGDTWGFNLYAAYKQAAQAIPRSRKKGKRHVITYPNFITYLYVLRRLGLIEYTIDPSTGKIKEDTAVDKAGNYAPYLSKTHYFHIVAGRSGDSAWSNIWLAYKGAR